jgi:hypothetical protein
MDSTKIRIELRDVLFSQSDRAEKGAVLTVPRGTPNDGRSHNYAALVLFPYFLPKDFEFTGIPLDGEIIEGTDITIAEVKALIAIKRANQSSQRNAIARHFFLFESRSSRG